ncbi:MFS transporter [Mycolicibacterium wolinskyi]|uniref:MFS transporter n=1 Tax=Mycolicibacterium wolinskyi TaxID=59750 RepID=UPI00082AA6CA|nr:MFS transporter [Mycolicibacterium wolinskyi]
MKSSEQVVQDLPWKWSVQGKITIIGGLGYMFDAWDVALNGYLTPLVGTQFDLSASDRSLVAGANLIGMAVGAGVWGTIADRLGRKKAFSLTILTFSLFSVLGALSPNYEVFLLLRFLAGVGLGGCVPVDFAMVSEFAPRKQRGRAVASIGLWWPIGATLAGATSIVLLPVEQNWRWMLATMVLPALLLVWIRRGIPESPLYLARRGREVEARRVIDDLVRRTGATAEPYVVPPRPIEADRGQGSKLVVAFQQLKLVWTVNPRVTSVAWFLSISILVVYYAALSWMPTVLRAQGYDHQSAFASTTMMTAVGIVAVLLSIALVDVVGRRWLIAITAPAASLALIAFAFMLELRGEAVLWLVLFGLLIQVTMPVLYTYTSELFPTELRASGFGWTSTVSRIATGFSPILFGAVLWPHLGLPGTFVVLAVAVSASVAWMLVAGPETRGRELDHIAESRLPAAAVDPAATSPNPVADSVSSGIAPLPQQSDHRGKPRIDN